MRGRLPVGGWKTGTKANRLFRANADRYPGGAYPWYFRFARSHRPDGRRRGRGGGPGGICTGTAPAGTAWNCSTRPVPPADRGTEDPPAPLSTRPTRSAPRTVTTVFAALLADADGTPRAEPRPSPVREVPYRHPAVAQNRGHPARLVRGPGRARGRGRTAAGRVPNSEGTRSSAIGWFLANRKQGRSLRPRAVAAVPGAKGRNPCG